MKNKSAVQCAYGLFSCCCFYNTCVSAVTLPWADEEQIRNLTWRQSESSDQACLVWVSENIYDPEWARRQFSLLLLLCLCSSWQRPSETSPSQVWRNCAPALSVTQNGAVSAGPCLSCSPQWSPYDNVWPLRHSRLKHCAGFHQSPLWQRQMVQSSTFTSIPAGMIVVPAKQFGPFLQMGQHCSGS